MKRHDGDGSRTLTQQASRPRDQGTFTHTGRPGEPNHIALTRVRQQGSQERLSLRPASFQAGQEPGDSTPVPDAGLIQQLPIIGIEGQISHARFGPEGSPE